MRVALISCPFDILAPNLALSTFKTQLSNYHIDSDVLYFNLQLSKNIGISIYEKYRLHGEWASCGNLFECDNEKYFVANNIKNEEKQLVIFKKTTAKYLECIHQSTNWNIYDIFAFSISKNQLCFSLSLAKKLKQQFPDKLIILGGYIVHGDVGIDIFNRFDFIDVIFLRDADESFVSFVSMYQISRNTDINMPNMITKHKCNYNNSTLILDMNKVPVPDFSDWIKMSVHPFDSYYPIQLSRGCYYGEKKPCAFCADTAMWGHSFEAKNTDNAFAYLQELKTKYPLMSHWKIVDSAFPRMYIKTVLKKWNDKYNTSFGDVRLSSQPWLTKQEVKILKDFGVSMIGVGIESFSDNILVKLNKGHRLHHSISVLKWCKRYNITVCWNYLIDIPGETANDYTIGLNVGKKLCHFYPPAFISHIQILKLSQYYQNRHNWKFKNLRPSTLSAFHFLKDDEIEKLSQQFIYDVEHPEETLKHRYNLIRFFKQWMKSEPRTLSFKDDYIIDTRFSPKRINISKREKELLVSCDSAQPIQDVYDYFKDVDIQKLIRLDLLIENYRKFISLVESGT